MSRYVHLFLWITLAFPAFSQNRYEPGTGLQLAYRQIINLEINKANQTLSHLSLTDKSHALFYYVENLAEIISILLNENKSFYEGLQSHEKSRLQQLERLDDNNPYKLYVMSEIKLQWAFIRLKFGDSFSAGWGIKQAYKLAHENHRTYPGFIPNYKTLGILNILIGSVPQNYQWLLNLFGLNGSVSEGLELLSKIENTDDIFSLEAAILRCLSGVYILQENSLIKSFLKVYLAHPDNLLVKFAYAAVNFKSHHSEKALDIIRETQRFGKDYTKIHYFDYLEGKILLQKKSYTLAAYYFNRFIGKYGGENNIKDAYFQLFLCYWLSDQKEKAMDIYALAKSKGSPTSTADKYADRILRNGEFPHKQIMQIRLATDGGYYSLAEEQIKNLSGNQLVTDKNKTELVYRKARLSHLQDQISQALTQYQKTIDMTQKKPWYFAPSAALQLGQIYTDQKNYDRARYYFNLALTFRNHPYKQSLDRQAKSWLKKIETQK